MAGLGAAVDNQYAGTLTGEDLGHCLADAAVGTGDDGRLAGEAYRHSFLVVINFVL